MSTSGTVRPAPNAWWVGVVCGLATFVDTGITTGIPIALVLFQALKPDMPGLSPTEVGLLTGALTAGVAIGSLLGGRLGDHWGRRTVFLVTMAVTAVGAAIPLLGVALPTLLIGVSLIGIGVGADLPVALATISEAANDRNRGKILVFSNLLGGFGILLAVLLAINFGASGPAGGLVIFGTFAAVALGVFLLRLTIPESASWLTARDEHRAGIHTVRAERVRLRDFGQVPYRRPFFTLIGYYALAAMATSVAGSFGTFVAVNITGASIAEYNSWTTLAMPAAIVAAIWFMAVVDTKLRMSYYVVGSIGVVLANLLPVIFGFSLPALIVSTVATVFFSAFCFETIMKVWTQESFPTMLRATAQGTVYAVSRFATAGLNIVTPALVLLNPSALYVGVSVLAGAGFFIGWLGFRRNARNEFDLESALVSPQGELDATPVREGEQS
ncbi:MFS transporter [Sinomonas sp. ASV322]|uniref:MFS transporter n=1 Tax=Sinomonas sp. ASV322 TaxID=3041920 RepID=UPI0027DB585B|nr:MFS transporter [Sinomonas sp. ASV322]MDQ4501569.1 MFS transporter [Sinomonas sp. ASV322]